MFDLLRHIKNPQNMDEVTNILLYFTNHFETYTEGELEYKQKKLEQLLNLGEEEIYNLLLRELNLTP